MARAKDPTAPIRARAAKLPDVVEGTACNQTTFKVEKSGFLYIGPGARGIGFKAMFELDRSLPQSRRLAEKEPDRYEVDRTGRVTTRFSAEEPLPKSVWEKWLKESYELSAR
jgi:hypothetical protein